MPLRIGFLRAIRQQYVCWTGWPEEDRMMRISPETISLNCLCRPGRGGIPAALVYPSGEIDLCGHATLAAAFVITEFISPGLDVVLFDTLSGRLTVRKRGELLEMDFPAYQLKRLEVTDQITEALGARPSEVWRARDLLCVFEDPETVIRLEPDQEKLKELKGALMQVTAPGSGEFDCVSRSFAPKRGCQRTRCAALATATSSPTGLPDGTEGVYRPPGVSARRNPLLPLGGGPGYPGGRAALYARCELMLEDC